MQTTVHVSTLAKFQLWQHGNRCPQLNIGKTVSQVGRYGPESFDFSREKVTASVSESLQRLQVG